MSADRPCLPRRAIRILVATLLGSAGISGCYAYTAVTPEAVPEGSLVRARLSEAESNRLGLRDLLPIDGLVVEGRVEASDPELRLLVPVRADAGWTPPNSQLNQMLAIHRDGVMELEIKELNRGQTVLVSSVGVAILTAIIIDNLTGWFGGGRESFGPDKDGIM